LIALVSVLVAGAVLVYFFRFDLEEPRRCLMALATAGFFFAPLSAKPLRVWPWLLGLGVTAWAAQIAGTGRGGLALWAGCSVAGSLLLMRGGSRAATYYLPEASSDAGRSLQREIRSQLQVSVALFLAGYLLDRPVGALLVAASALFFLRYALLQSKHLGIPAVPLVLERGLVPSQRWVVLVLLALTAGTRLPRELLGEDRGSLMFTAALLLATAAVVFVLSLTRMGWPRSLLRRASFAAGLFLAVAGTAVLVELESWDRARYRVFASICIAFLVVLPFLESQTKLFTRWPHASMLVPSAALGVMMAPVSAMGVTRESSSTAVFLAAFSTLLLAYYLLVGVRAKAKGNVYLAASLGLVLFTILGGGGDRAVQVFLISLGFALYAIERIECVWRESRARATIATQ
jgi:hypothetical protein